MLTYDIQKLLLCLLFLYPVGYLHSAPLYIATVKVSKGAKIRNQYNQVPNLTQDTNGKVTNLQLDTTNESQESSPLQQVTTRHIKTNGHKGTTNGRQKKHKRSTKEVPPWNGH